MQEHLTQANERVPEHAPSAEHLEVEERLRDMERQLAERDMQVAALTQQLEERSAAGEILCSSSGCSCLILAQSGRALAFREANDYKQ